ncbi:MAG: sodium:proline symporter [Bacteroidetes bacterium]|jgi:Na+/proline symporter|nr:sodium:proline symporter [Bacteroidota bacterium]
MNAILTDLDLLIIILFFVVIAVITIYFTRRAGRDTQQFFLSGRNLPWYLSGTAMVATTFAADTPLAVTELVAKSGIAGNWLWWNMAIGGLLTVFFFARLWRRAGIMTDLEFTEIRYAGKPAAILRGFRAIYLGLFMNIVILAWVHKAMEKIFLIVFPEAPPFMLVIILAGMAALYALLSGLLGSVRTDSFQFVFALAGCIILAVFVVKNPAVGGIENLKAALPAESLHFFPTISTISAPGKTLFAIGIGAFAAYALIQWWASWYPGNDPGGGGYIAQRMMSAKDEKHSMLGTLWFNIAHYTLRPWPWIIVALAALVILPKASSEKELEKLNPGLYQAAKSIHEEGDAYQKLQQLNNPELNHFYQQYENTVDPGTMYPKLMVRYLPSGLLGLLIAVFMAAYMSTIASQLNWGTSYIVHDFYKRFLHKHKTEKHYVAISRLTIVVLVTLSLILANTVLHTISGAWVFIINASAGIGGVLILRWYWWRINAWSEISAMLAPLIFYPVSVYIFRLEPPLSMYPTVGFSTLTWVIVTFLTKPESTEVLTSFCKKIRPAGPGWKTFHATFKPDSGDEIRRNLICWMLSVIAIYGALIGTGKIIFREYVHGIVGLAACLISGMIIYRILSKKEKNI